MSDSISFDVTLAHKIKRALIRNGIRNVAVLDWLAAGDNIKKVELLHLGAAELVTFKHLIDLDAEPFVPKGHTVISHRKGGKLKWFPDVGFSLHLEPDQRQGFGLNGSILRSRLEKLPVLNANVLDFLYKNQHLIPEKWKGYELFFWGTIYCYKSEGLDVRFLRWTGESWAIGLKYVGAAWNDRHLAVLDASAMLDTAL